jgi:hypothetical protein
MLSIIKGWLGEKETQLGLWIKLDSEIYKRFHNLIVPTQNGTTQIDHVLLSKYGIFVIETKNYEDWIFGDEHQKMWTQALYGKRVNSRTLSIRTSNIQRPWSNTCGLMLKESIRWSSSLVMRPSKRVSHRTS